MSMWVIAGGRSVHDDVQVKLVQYQLCCDSTITPTLGSSFPR